MFRKSSLAAIIIPGLLSGFIIWAVVTGSDNFLTSSGHESMRGTLFPLMMLTVVPLLVIATGAVAEKMHCQDPNCSWKPIISYLAGFLGMCCAGLIAGFESGMNQYIPYFPSGLTPRLIFALGRALVYLTFMTILGIFFALFALAGGYYVYRVRERRVQNNK
ncbi:MAG: hypothetical protein Q7T80_11290 [Methanoregula sp.]|nr:hypothetical protein [Methanoregula sp.]